MISRDDGPARHPSSSQRRVPSGRTEPEYDLPPVWPYVLLIVGVLFVVAAFVVYAIVSAP